MGSYLYQRANRLQGFTIIETMLVLAVTGVLIASLLVGVGTTLNAQRYKDAVSSFKSLVQQQYAELNNVANDRNSNWTCGSNATPVQANSGIAPGQSNCVLLGRLMTVDATTIKTASVVGYQTATTMQPTDVQTLKSDYTLGVSSDSIESSSLEWGAQIAWPKSGAGARTPTTPRTLSLLFVRSPDSGTIYTFSSDTANPIDAVSSAYLKSIMVESVAAIPGQGPRTICIDPDAAGASDAYALYIAQGANTPGAIETRTNDTTKSLGGTSQC